MCILNYTSNKGKEMKLGIIDLCIDWENGKLSDEQTIHLFQHLIDNGWIKLFSGKYSEMADALIKNGSCRECKV